MKLSLAFLIGSAASLWWGLHELTMGGHLDLSVTGVVALLLTPLALLPLLPSPLFLLASVVTIIE